jgi:hypothetical protein
MASTEDNNHETTAAQEPTSELIGNLLSDTKDLISAHAGRFRHEVREELGALQNAIKLTGITIAGALLAGLLLTQALVFGLTAATGLPLWASFAIVGAVAGLVGYAAYRKRAPTSQVDLIPEQSIAAVKRDVERIASSVHS